MTKHIAFLWIIFWASFTFAEPIFLPLVYYTPETQVAAGFVSINRFHSVGPGRTSQIITSASLTTQGQSLGSIAPRFFLDEGKYEVGGFLFYSYFPFRYYGVGLDNNLEEPEKYIENNLILNTNFAYQFVQDWFVRFTLGFDQRKNEGIEPGGRLEQDLSSYSAEYQTSQAGISFEHDTRDIPTAPTKGTFSRISKTYFVPKNRGSDLELQNFSRNEIEFRFFRPLQSEIIFAGQVFASDVREGNIIPFHYLNTIGGGNRLRGYYAGRFREKALVLTQAEIRYQWKDRWNFAGFIGAADLAESSADFFTKKSRSFNTIGGGVRYVLDPDNRTSLRFDMGFAERSVSVYFLVGEAF